MTWRRPRSPLGPPRLSGNGSGTGSGVAGLAEEYLPDPLFSHPALALPLRLGTIAPGPALVLRPVSVLALVGDAEVSLATADKLEQRIDEDDTVIVVSHRRLGPLAGRAL